MIVFGIVACLVGLASCLACGGQSRGRLHLRLDVFKALKEIAGNVTDPTIEIAVRNAERFRQPRLYLCTVCASCGDDILFDPELECLESWPGVPVSKKEIAGFA